jgi:hypothetical protein
LPVLPDAKIAGAAGGQLDTPSTEFLTTLHGPNLDGSAANTPGCRAARRSDRNKDKPTPEYRTSGSKRASFAKRRWSVQQDSGSEAADGDASEEGTEQPEQDADPVQQDPYDTISADDPVLLCDSVEELCQRLLKTVRPCSRFASSCLATCGRQRGRNDLAKCPSPDCVQMDA